MTLTLTYKDAKYTLEYTKETVMVLEARGYNKDDISSKFVSTMTPLYECAFLAHHPLLTSEFLAEILSKIPNKVDFYKKLAEMADEQAALLIQEPDESEGNASWMVS